jgi:hypothetical protein
MKSIVLLAALAFLSSITLASRAGHSVSYTTSDLGRITSFSLVVEPIDANGQTCGIQQSTISNAIEYPLVGTGLTIGAKSDSYLSVETSTIIVGANCVTSYSMELLTRLTVRFHEQLSRARVLLWESGGLFYRLSLIMHLIAMKFLGKRREILS